MTVPQPITVDRLKNVRDEVHFVYRLWNYNTCIYVGMTANLGSRLGTHQRGPWWKEVTRMDAAWVLGREGARSREAEEIAALQPRYNIQLTDDPTERRLSRSKR